MKVLILAALLSVSACNARFHADFEADTPGSPPALNPPGAPDDRIEIVDSGGATDGIVIRVTDEANLVASGQPFRFMSLIREPNPSASSHAWLETAPMATSTRSIFVEWEQVLVGGGTGRMAFFALPDDSGTEPEVCWVFTGNDAISLQCGSSAQEIEGIDTHAVHTVLMRFDRSPRRAVMQAAQAGSTSSLVTIEGGDLPAPVEGQRFVAQIEHDGQSDSAYRFNSFDVQERDPN